MQRIKAVKNNPRGLSFDQDKLLEIIKKQQEKILILKRAVERLEKDVVRYQSELQIKQKINFDGDQRSSLTRNTSEALSMTGANKAPFVTDFMTQVYFNQVERSLINQGLDLDQGLQTFRKFVGQLKSEIHILKSQSGKKDATIKRYR